MASSQPRFANRTFHMLSVRHMICKHVPSSMNEYNCTAVTIQWTVFVNYSMFSDYLLEIAHTCYAISRMAAQSQDWNPISEF